MTERLVQLQWLRVPLVVARRWPAAGVALADGNHLVRRPVVAAVAQPAAFLLGLLLAAVTRDLAYTGNLLVVGLVGLVGLLGAALGLWATVGLGLGLLVVGDDIAPWLSGPAWVVRGLLPALLSFAVLGLLAVVVPLTMNGVRAGVRGAARIPSGLRPGAEVLAAAVTVGLSAYIWASTAPLLIRPLFVWAGTTPTVEAVAPLQQRGVWLALVLALCGAGRVLLERRATGGRVATFSLVLAAGLAQPSRTRAPAPVRAVLGAAATTFLLSGLIGSVIEAVAVLVFFTGLLLLRDRLAERPPSVVDQLLRVPRPVRIGAGLVLGYLATRAVLGFFWVRTQTFLPVLVAACVGAALITLLGIQARRAAARPSTPDPAHPATSGGPA